MEYGQLYLFEYFFSHCKDRDECYGILSTQTFISRSIQIFLIFLRISHTLKYFHMLIHFIRQSKYFIFINYYSWENNEFNGFVNQNTSFLLITTLEKRKQWISNWFVNLALKLKFAWSWQKISTFFKMIKHSERAIFHVNLAYIHGTIDENPFFMTQINSHFLSLFQ